MNNSLSFDQVFPLRQLSEKKVKCFSSYGSLPKVWTHIGRCPVITLSGNLCPKNLFSSYLVTEERDTSIAGCSPRGWTDRLFDSCLPGLKESANLESLHGALKCTSSFPTKIVQAESSALSILEQQKLLVPPAALIKREIGVCWFVWYQRI